ncbi:anaerobic ribonucleoside-triphosphate reductase activating protein [Niallia sp. 01092]|uniref:anaerobic ribonucleoside-triphosphate reductase activating protein n=1 Tax=unclassified Niallia TaxID=2837522 RepID=UPI003FD10193
MRVLNIIHDSIVDGPGLRSTVFFAGCPHKCTGCHNPQSWNKDGGVEMSIQAIYDELMDNPLTNITFSGGEPLLQLNDLAILAEKLKKAGKNIWCYTGYKWEYLMEAKKEPFMKLCKELDILVDGPFVKEKRDLSLLYRGSSNQRVINCRKSIEEKKMVLLEQQLIFS